jgi:hypothetical protein
MDALDYPAALRCYRACNDERGVARAYEHLGQFDEAMALWAKLGRPREIARLRKKYPLARVPGTEGQTELF